MIHRDGWSSLLTAPLAQKYFSYLEKIEEIVVPALIIYEVYKKIKRERSEEDALLAVAHMGKARVVVLDDSLALTAADVSLRYNLAMADAIIYATALEKAKSLPVINIFLGFITWLS